MNKIQRILHRHNLMWSYPTKGFQTKAGLAWLETVTLPEVDRFEMIQEWKTLDEQIEQVNVKIRERANRSVPGQILNSAQLLMTAPGVSYYSGLGLASRIGSIKRFPRPRSLANYFGLTPGCRNSGNATERLGAITKAGSTIVRHVLNHAVLHVLRGDISMRRWHKRIKKRRGTKIARVAVMRRLATIIWHMLKRQAVYRYDFGPYGEVLEHAS